MIGLRVSFLDTGDVAAAVFAIRVSHVYIPCLHNHGVGGSNSPSPFSFEPSPPTLPRCRRGLPPLTSFRKSSSTSCVLRSDGDGVRGDGAAADMRILGMRSGLGASTIGVGGGGGGSIDVVFAAGTGEAGGEVIVAGVGLRVGVRSWLRLRMRMRMRL